MKNENVFGLELQHAEINKRFIDTGWIEVYRSSNNDSVDSGIYCCLVKPDYLKKYLEDRDWGIHWGSEGHPSVITNIKMANPSRNIIRFQNKGWNRLFFLGGLVM
mgnify:CR=1 FL=1